MWSHLARVAAAVALAVLPTLISPTTMQAAGASPAEASQTVRGPAAKGDDVCPEPNDTFQAACFLGAHSAALGFLSRPDDVDAYRIEVYDYNTDIHAEISEMPAAYKLYLANWNGDELATSTRQGNAEVIDFTVGIPGAYYIFVHSASGGFSAGAPYSIFRALTYPGSSIPIRLFSSEFREGAKSAIEGDFEHAVHTEDAGRYTIAMKNAGVPSDPSEAWWTGFGPEITDFTMAVDTRVSVGARGGSSIFFRHQNNQNTYQVGLDPSNQAVNLWKIANGEVSGTGWKESEIINVNGVNRVVIYAFADQIRINVNGEEMISVTDGTFMNGYIGIGAMTWGEPATVNFDNIIIATPGEGL